MNKYGWRAVKEPSWFKAGHRLTYAQYFLKKIYFLKIWRVLDEIASETFTTLLFRNISDFSDVHLMNL